MRILLLPLASTLILAGTAVAQTPPAKAVNYGNGTVLNQSSTQGTIPMPRHLTYYTAARTRGYFFQAPVAFAVTGLQVPDILKKGYQTVALYRLQAAPPAYSKTVNVKPLFFKRWAKSGSYIPVVPPVIFNKGDYFVVLGAASANNSQVMTNDYGPAKPQVQVGGKTVTLYRCGMQASIAASSGPGANGVGPLWSEVSASISRVMANILVFQTPFPRLDTTAPPVLGTTAKLQLTANIPSTTLGLVLLGLGRAKISTPLGTLLIGSPILTGMTVASGSGSLSLPIPKNPVLAGGMVNFQGFAVALPANFGTSNGVEWVLGY